MKAGMLGLACCAEIVQAGRSACKVIIQLAWVCLLSCMCAEGIRDTITADFRHRPVNTHLLLDLQLLQRSVQFLLQRRHCLL